MDLNKMRSQINGAASAAANDWYPRQCKDVYCSMYAYFKPGTIAFWIGENGLTDKWKLVTGERISPAWTIDAVKRHLIDKAQRLPILPV